MSSPLIFSQRSLGPLSPATGASAESANASNAVGSATPTQGSGGNGGELTGIQPPSGAVASDANAASWLLAWGVLIVLLVLINRTRIGATITYYVLALAVLFLVLTQYKFIAATLAPFQNSQQALSENGTSPGAPADTSGGGGGSADTGA